MTKISALSDIGTSVASNDVFVLVDASDPTTPNKKIQHQNFFLIPDGSAATPGLRFLNDTDTGIYRSGNNTLGLVTGASTRLYIDSSGRVGIGTTSPYQELTLRGTSEQLLFDLNTTTNGQYASIAWNGSTSDIGTGAYSVEIRGYREDAGALGALTFHTRGISAISEERARIDSSGRLLVGTSTARTVESAPGTAGVPKFQVEGNDGASSQVLITDTRLDGRNPSLALAKTRNGAIVAADDILGSVSFFGDDGTDTRTWGGRITCEVDGTPGANDMPGRLVFSTTANGASSPTERMRIDSNGKVTVSRGGSTEGDESFSAGSASTASVRIFTSTSLGNSTAAAATWIRKNSSTNRSINAAGTVNASGADYAEYMTKAGDFTIAKGDICGIDPNGKLTNVFANAVGFVVKSTDPSYVGGDSWGADIEDPVQLETERQKVDRIAFAGQVPVNLTGANPGQYIVPIETDDGGITGIAKDETDLTLAEYMSAVGKVIAIENDGRARIIVKVA